ncbi:MAG: MMPL family transporter, partial [Cohnella sp.]|nr:MMPL family transporter [Cohnella sp.]
MGFRKLAEFSIRRYKGIIVCWLLAASLSAVFAAKLPEVLGDHGLRTNGPYAQAQELLQSEWGIPGEPIVLLFERERGSSVRDFRTYVSRSLADVEAIGGVDVTASPLDRLDMRDDRYAYAIVSAQGSSDAVTTAIGRIRSAIKDDPRFGIRLTGKPVVQDDVNRSSRRDLKTAETLGIPVAFVLLLLTFGGLWPALIPILAGVLSVVIAMGLTYAIGALEIAELSVFVYNVIPMAGMAVCIDFALLMVSRYREEGANFPPREAIIRTTAYSGRAITVSVVCVI